ncbi:MAG: gfo/Idh/MocA family oxidoreductase [Acidobacteria bacterium]|nr:MAG: gfo/Idh/MocA family oxidoreductase [Acidobacteriota bacterium]
MSDNQKSMTRRSFLGNSARAATAAGLVAQATIGPASGRVLGANDRIRMGFIGIGNRGSELLGYFMAAPDVEIAALCDVYEPYLWRDRSKVHPGILKEVGNKSPQMGEKFASEPFRHKDFRKILERKDIDAVCIATPDHWHAIQMILACEAGKDVYVEKPLTVAVAEGRRMVEAAKRTNRVVQVGLNRRGSSTYKEAAGLVNSGTIGKVTVARALYTSRMYPNGIGQAKPEDPPPGLDWDMWLGPRAFRPYQRNIAPYKFRWWQDYSSQMANWGVHYLDAIRWLVNERAPVSVTAYGGKYLLTDDRTIPDTLEVTFEFPSGALAVFGVYEAAGGSTLPEGEVELRGAQGNLYIDDRSYHVLPSKPGQFQEGQATIQDQKKTLADRENPTVNMVRNFLDCVKSRQKGWCDIEEGHRSTTFALLANIALATKSRLTWDPDTERITNLPEANRYLDYEYRKPWGQS